ncbi:MAG: hypothetical protein ACI8VI_000643 [Granulosicoccus sp.]|jgi:hypothetical protein
MLPHETLLVLYMDVYRNFNFSTRKFTIGSVFLCLIDECLTVRAFARSKLSAFFRFFGLNLKFIVYFVTIPERGLTRTILKYNFHYYNGVIVTHLNITSIALANL